MKENQAVIETRIVVSDDGRNTYRLTKHLAGVEGESAYLISLYPTRSEENVFANDSTTNHLVSHMQELGISKLNIINLFSRTVTSQRGLTVDEENMDYIEELMQTEDFKSCKLIVAWGNSMQNSQAVAESKVRIFNIFLKHCPKNKLYQLTTLDGRIDSTIAPHPLFLGIRANDSIWGLKEFKIKKPSHATSTKAKATNIAKKS